MGANPGAGTAALERLSGDAGPAVVEIVAGNPRAPLPSWPGGGSVTSRGGRRRTFILRSLPAGAARDAALARLDHAGDRVALDSLLN